MKKQKPHTKGLEMYATTGINSQQFASLVTHITELYHQGTITVGVRSIPNVGDRVLIVLFYLRHNLSQQTIAELFHTSQPTVSRLITTLGTHLRDTVEPTRPTLEDINPDADLIVDGALLPTWDCKEHPENYSGTHHRCGMGIQLACNLYHNLVWVSDAYCGSMHDAKAVEESGLLAQHRESGCGRLIGDRGYIGVCHLTPVRKPPGGHLSEGGPGVQQGQLIRFGGRWSKKSRMRKNFGVYPPRIADR